MEIFSNGVKIVPSDIMIFLTKARDDIEKSKKGSQYLRAFNKTKEDEVYYNIKKDKKDKMGFFVRKEGEKYVYKNHDTET